MKPRLLGILVIGLYGVLAGSGFGKEVKLFLLGGQSNMDGCGTWNELSDELRKLPPHVGIWDNHERKWVAIGEDTMAIGRDRMFGPELLFAHCLAKAFPNQEIALIKTSAGGTKLQDHWLPGKPMYERFIQNYRNAIADLAASGTTYDLCGMLWMQGESDSETIEMANAYERNLKTMFADVRAKTGKPHLPIVMGRISCSLLKKTPWNFEHSPLVRKAQEAVAAADPDVAMIDTDALTTLSDNTHFDTQGQTRLGEAMAARMLDLLRRPAQGNR